MRDQQESSIHFDLATGQEVVQSVVVSFTQWKVCNGSKHELGSEF